MPGLRISHYRLVLCVLGVLGAASLIGCASVPAKRWSSTSALDSRSPPHSRHSPALTRVTLTFLTGKHAKLASSGVWVLVVDRTWNTTLVRSTNIERAYSGGGTLPSHGYFARYSSHAVVLPFARSNRTYGIFATGQQLEEHHYVIPRAALRVWRKNNCRHLIFEIGLMARGALLGTTGNTFGFDGHPVYSGYGGYNKWTFGVLLTLYFNDGSSFTYYRPNLTLTSTDGKLVFTTTK